jgi:hypothetical protein
MTSSYISAKITYAMWLEEHLWNVSVLQRAHFPVFLIWIICFCCTKPASLFRLFTSYLKHRGIELIALYVNQEQLFLIIGILYCLKVLICFSCNFSRSSFSLFLFDLRPLEECTESRTSKSDENVIGSGRLRHFVSLLQLTNS